MAWRTSNDCVFTLTHWQVFSAHLWRTFPRSSKISFDYKKHTYHVIDQSSSFYSCDVEVVCIFHISLIHCCPKTDCYQRLIIFLATWLFIHVSRAIAHPHIMQWERNAVIFKLYWIVHDFLRKIAARLKLFCNVPGLVIKIMTPKQKVGIPCT